MVLAIKKGLPIYIYVVLDKSGSMLSIKDQIISGFNEFLQGQKQDYLEHPEFGDIFLSLIQFDTEVNTIYENEPILNVKKLSNSTYKPRGNTALFDAIATGIFTLEKVEKDAKLLLVIQTDGEENSSKRFTKKEAIK